MGRAGHQREEPGDKRCQEGDTAGVLLQEPHRHIHQVVHAAGSLQSRRGGDDADDDEHDVDGDGARRQPEDEHKDGYSQHTIDAKSDAADLGTDNNHGQHDEQLKDNQHSLSI